MKINTAPTTLKLALALDDLAAITVAALPFKETADQHQ